MHESSDRGIHSLSFIIVDLCREQSALGLQTQETLVVEEASICAMRIPEVTVMVPLKSLPIVFGELSTVKP